MRQPVHFVLAISFLLAFTDVDGQTVYTTKTGKKYHKQGCYHLKSKVAMQQKDAISKGYQPCGTCKPNAEKGVNRLTEQKQERPSIETNSTRCQAITKAGSQCKRQGKYDGYCYQHNQ